MFCKNCGSALRDGAKFCHFCGTPVTVIPKTPTVNTAGENTQPAPAATPAVQPVQPAVEPVQQPAIEPEQPVVVPVQQPEVEPEQPIVVPVQPAVEPEQKPEVEPEQEPAIEIVRETVTSTVETVVIEDEPKAETEPEQAPASEPAQENVTVEATESIPTAEDNVTAAGEEATIAVFEDLIKEDQSAPASVQENVENVVQTAAPAAAENQTYAAPAYGTAQFAPETQRAAATGTPFKRAFAKVAASPLFLTFAIIFTIATATNIFNVINFTFKNGISYSINFNIFPVLTIALGIVTAVSLFRINSTAKKDPNANELPGGTNTYVIYKEICSWLLLALMILLIVAVVFLLVATLVPNGFINETMNTINWTQGISFGDSFGELLGSDVVDTIYRAVPNIDEVWDSVLSSIYQVAEQLNLDAPGDFLYLLYIAEIVLIVVLGICAVGTILSAIYYIKLRKYVSRARRAWTTNSTFKNKSGFISFFSVVFAIYYIIEALSALFTAPLSAITYGTTAAAFIILMLLLKKFKKALAFENSVSEY